MDVILAEAWGPSIQRNSLLTAAGRSHEPLQLGPLKQASCKVEDEIAGMMCDSYGNYLCSRSLSATTLNCAKVGSLLMTAEHKSWSV